MKISRISGIDTENDWLGGFALPSPTTPKKVVTAFSSDVSPLKDEAVDETVLAFECDKIEKCASENKPYFYNKHWGQESVSQLKEYASVCGLSSENVIAAEFAFLEPAEGLQKAASATPTTKTAETVEKKTMKIDLGDAFRFEEKIAAATRQERDWQVNTPSQKLELNPVMTGGIVPVRGGENYNIQNTPKLANNQNSMANPHAIEELANSEQLDTGARLAKERQERVAQKEQNKKQWQQDLIDSMVHKDIVAHGKVFPTETLNAQPGLGSPASRRIAGNFDPANVADKTAGEQLKEQNKARHEAISRPREEFNWEEARGQTVRGISDSFTDSLKKAMGK